MNRGLFRITAILIALICVIVSHPRETLGQISRWLSAGEEPAKSDVIVVLLGDFEGRPHKASKLFHAGFADKIVFVSGYYMRPYFPLALKGEWMPTGDWYHALLKRWKVPDQNMIVLPGDGVYDTSSELGVVADWVQKNGARSVLLVTSPSHSRRTLLIWERLMPLVPARIATYADPQFEEWWRHKRTRRTVAYETGALIKESIRQILERAIFW